MTKRDSAEATRTARVGLIERLADNKYLLGQRYAEWCSSGPSLESSVAAAAMAQDELGHARALYPVLKSLAPDLGAEAEPETRTHFVNLSALDTTFADWPAFVAVNFLTDTAITEVFRAAVESSLAPLAGRSRKTLMEEQTHWQHAAGWVRRLARSEAPLRAALEAALRAQWDETLMWFGQAGSNDALAADKTLDADPDELRQRFLGRIGPVLVAEGLALPVRERGQGEFELTEPLPWDRWDAASWRLAAVPAKA